jgi:hypothetical protein
MAKTYSQTYLYSQYSEYEKKIYEFIINAERIDTKSSEFDEILYDIKRGRRISDNLSKVITSDNVVIGINSGKALPKAFKSFVAADVKDGSKVKAFIDVTDCIVYKNGIYVCNKLDWFISYIINAMTSYVYVKAENKLIGNASILKDGCDAWTRCFSYIIDRMYKISTVMQVKNRVDYLAGIYYQVALMGKDIVKNEDSIKANAIRTSNIDPKDARVVDIMIADGDFRNIDTFVKALGRIIQFKDIKTGNIVSYWMNAFGPGTVFALEYLPAFSAMMTNTYVGAYLDQQMTIEKVAGQSMINFSKTILQIGASV